MPLVLPPRNNQLVNYWDVVQDRGAGPRAFDGEHAVNKRAGDHTFMLSAVLFGAPVAHLKTWESARWELRIKQKLYFENPMWMLPDDVEKLAEVMDQDVLFMDVKSPLDWRFLVFKLIKPYAVWHKDTVEVRVDLAPGALPEGRLRCVLRGRASVDVL